jgi:FlaG/FlaF family flagellin (archaellin)
MSTMSIIGLVAIVAILAGLVSRWIEAQSSQGKHDHDSEAIKALEERVRVLEAIVTDKRFELNRELDNLKREDS